MIEIGVIIQVTGPVVLAANMRGSRMYELVKVGDWNLIGEIIELEDDVATIQVYEETSGIKPGETVKGTGISLSVELAPGLLGRIYDGIQRPLVMIQEQAGDYIKRGIEVPSIRRDVKWDFTPLVSVGDQVIPGDVLGSVPETKTIVHKILVPPGISGRVIKIAPAGAYTIEDLIAKVETYDEIAEIRMLQRWAVRRPRPYDKKLEPQ
ncbi:MAG: V-type ATP synthase subunit A, partial [Methanogenium sp.]|nr:V-type ATP synthase subunit A [Methanogenium sp.]